MSIPRIIQLVAILFAPLVSATGAQAVRAFVHPSSAAPGETVQVYVNTSAPTIEVEVRRSYYFGDEVAVLNSGTIPGIAQGAASGSLAEVSDNAILDIVGAISLEAWVRPLSISTTGFAGILLKYLNPGETAYGIYLMPGGQVSFYLGSTGVFSTSNRLLTTNPLPRNRWTHIVATYDGHQKRIYLNGQLDVSQPRTGPIFNTSEPLRVGSFGPSSTFEGDIDSPVVYARTLTQPEVETRFNERAQYTPANPGILTGAVGQWNFDEMVGTSLADATGNGSDLTLVNHGTRGVPGPLLAGASGKPVNWAIRFSSSDRYNPAWTPSFSFVVPQNWESGYYAIHIQALSLPFVVRPVPGQESRIAVLANTNTWAAYNSWSGSLYSTKPGGSISRYVGLLQPNPDARMNLHTPGGSFSPRADAERYLYKWLDDNGHAFDIHGDLDLHREPALLSNYDVLIIQGHSEYWSSEMIDHVEAFQAAGGSLVNLSGNTMWSRVTFNPNFTVMEGRKHPWSSAIFPAGERWHSQAGQVLGGTWRCIGRPEHQVLGTGYGIQTFSSGVFGAYSVVDPNHWVFAGTGVQPGTFFGQTGQNGGAILGHEFDVVHPMWSPPNIQILARGANLNAHDLDISNCNVRVVRAVTEGGDMVYFDHPGGGGVFGAPSVAFGGALFVDAVAPKILDNVLQRFLNPSRCTFRNGTGVNPVGFDCVTPPAIGTNWDTTIATSPTTLTTYLGFGTSQAQFPFQGGELLIGLSPVPMFQLGSGTHSIPIPNNSAFLGESVFAQGFRFDLESGAPKLILLNGQDMQLGL